MDIETASNSRRQRSSRRLRHEAEIQVFKQKTGDLESIRQSLGLRPSQICEILKVHPSAWTRWVKEGQAPPHIYQMLEWYIELLSWRGQNNPVGGPFLPRKMSTQSPDSYLPEKEPFTPQVIQKYIEKKAFINILSVSFIIQATLTAALMLLFYFWLRR